MSGRCLKEIDTHKDYWFDWMNHHPGLNCVQELNLADEVAHLFALGLEVALIGGLAGDLGGDALDDFDAREFEGFDLLRVVGDQANGLDAHLLEDLGRKLEVTAIGPRSPARGWLQSCRGPDPEARRPGASP